jgi:VanZ family protein
VNIQQHNRTTRTLLGAICLLLTAAIVVAGLWPFDFNPVNKVEWQPDGQGLRFYGRGIVYSREPLVIQEPDSGSASFTIELMVRPEEESSNGVPSLLTLFDGSRPYRFMLGRWKRELIIRVPAGKGQNPQRYREISVGNALIKDTAAFITITSSKERTDVSVNGKVGGRFPGWSLVPGVSGLSGRLLLGNSPDGNNPWHGSLTGLAIYDRILDDKAIQSHYAAWRRSGRRLLSKDRKPIALYLFEGHDGRRIADLSGLGNDLLIPASFHPLQRRVLETPDRDQWFRRSNLIDVAINLLGFVPFGLFLAAWLAEEKNRSALQVCGVTVLLGVCLSLAIEVIQAYIPGRDSSLLDVISNTTGTAAGVSLLAYARLVLPSKAKGGSMR